MICLLSLPPFLLRRLLGRQVHGAAPHVGAAGEGAARCDAVSQMERGVRGERERERGGWMCGGFVIWDLSFRPRCLRRCAHAAAIIATTKAATGAVGNHRNVEGHACWAIYEWVGL